MARINLSFENIIKGLLSEAISNDDVLDAIRNKYYVKIHYDDGMDSNPKAKGMRVIQPMAFGTTKKGYPVVRAFQLNGNSRRGAPNWKFFRLDRITSWKPMPNKHFFSPPNDSYGEYNTSGDRSMGTFVGNAQFADMDNPLAKARAERQQMVNAPKISTKNANGPIPAVQQTKKNVFTSQPNSKKYAQYAKNIKDTENDLNRFDDDIWAKAEAERDAQNIVPQPQANTNGPITDYDVSDTEYNENDFKPNRNRR